MTTDEGAKRTSVEWLSCSARNIPYSTVTVAPLGLCLWAFGLVIQIHGGEPGGRKQLDWAFQPRSDHMRTVDLESGLNTPGISSLRWLNTVTNRFWQAQYPSVATSCGYYGRW